ncbi:zinc finger HIT domain-containing protein 3 [Pectinophora gossypiella]|uniref:HIT-type domain-containing protein n=1 Tax=Pectinophora gossypiella TaxID=13191 RepID=A0A1E1WU62_PECGO|nr:zinc finger HIT domain-containing protein 3 [Pectinophora gossypiella]
MNCVECSELSKYKCPTCVEPYCSVPCWKKHKSKPCAAPPPEPKTDLQEESITSYDFPTEDTVSPEKLSLLDQSADVKKCLENPHVRTILGILDKSPHPDELMQEYMLEPIFTEFVDACLKVVQPQGDKVG